MKARLLEFYSLGIGLVGTGRGLSSSFGSALGVRVRSLMGGNGRVDNVNSFPSGLGLTASGLSLFPHLFPVAIVFASGKTVRVPPRAQHIPSSEGFLL
jgi:hypothetical protein